jgi:hypothetical protein
MDKQTKNIRLTRTGAIKFKTGRTERPKNRVVEIHDNVVYFLMNKNKWIGSVDVDVYFRLSLWAHRLTFDHKDPLLGVVAYDNGYEHKSLAAAIMQTTKGQRVSYLNGSHFDCRVANLVVE